MDLLESVTKDEVALTGKTQCLIQFIHGPGDITRMAVPGGWLVKHEAFNHKNDSHVGYSPSTGEQLVVGGFSFNSTSMVFIPDPLHQWEQWASDMTDLQTKKDKLDEILLGEGDEKETT